MKLPSLLVALALLLAFAATTRADEFSAIENNPNTYWVPAPNGYVVAPAPYYYGPPPVYYYAPPPPPLPPPVPGFFIHFHFH